MQRPAFLRLAIGALAPGVACEPPGGPPPPPSGPVVGSGVAAGWYPAVRANRLTIIDALRNE